ncbi:MAG: hypothetical protein HYY40_02245 [Bacteroidetes bacterium]|nr:hypothetical protein [Bacteroidota bacterium]
MKKSISFTAPLKYSVPDFVRTAATTAVLIFFTPLFYSLPFAPHINFAKRFISLFLFLILCAWFGGIEGGCQSFQWAGGIGGSIDDYGRCIAVDAVSGAVYITGSFRNIAGFAV